MRSFEGRNHLQKKANTYYIISTKPYKPEIRTTCRQAAAPLSSCFIFSALQMFCIHSGIEKNLVNSLWEMDCQKALGLLVNVCFFLAPRSRPSGGLQQPPSLLSKSLPAQPKSTSFHSLPEVEHAKCLR